MSLLPGHLIIVSFWHTGNSRRSMAISVSGYLKAASYIPSLSPTLRWTCDVLFSLSDANQIFDLAGKAGVLNNFLPIGVSLRSTLVANLLLAGLTYRSPGITHIMRRMKIDKIEQDVVMYPDVDSLIGMLKPLVTPRRWAREMKETISYMPGHNCQIHSAVHAIPLSQHWHLSQLLKAFIAINSVEEMVVSPCTPPEVIVDLCHVTEIIINAQGDPIILEKAELANLCGAVSVRLMVQLSLSTLCSAKYYYDHSETVPGALVYGPLDNIFEVQGPCEGFHIMCLKQGGKVLDLSGACCKPYDIVNLCPAVSPVSESLFRLGVKSACDCLDAIQEFPLWSTGSRRSETEWSREIGHNVGLIELVKNLHQFLELIRKAIKVPCRPVCLYYRR